MKFANRTLACADQIRMGYPTDRRYEARQANGDGQIETSRWEGEAPLHFQEGAEWVDPYETYEPEFTLEEVYYLNPEVNWPEEILLQEEDEIDYQLDPNFRRAADTNPSTYLMLGVVLIVAFLLVLFGLWNLSEGAFPQAEMQPGMAPAADAGNPQMREVEIVPQIGSGEIAAFFAPSVQYWGKEIAAWATNHNLDPNMVATVMQIESCGDPSAVSRAGATGLFQVMPFHFTDGENAFDPDTNALRGMNYLADRLVQTNGDIGRAFAGYNGGHVAAASGWDSWVDETRRYYRWSTGIYAEAVENQPSSETLDAWMAAGGASLCAQAEAELGLR